jgi:hypothetical protein
VRWTFKCLRPAGIESPLGARQRKTRGACPHCLRR